MFPIKPHTILLFFFAALLTVIANMLIGKYQDDSQQLLFNPIFSEDLNGWQIRGEKGLEVIAENGTVTLENQDKERSIEVFQELTVPEGGGRFRFTADLRLANVIAGEKSWNKARLVFVQYIDGKPDYALRHVVSSLAGTRGWGKYSDVFRIATNCHTLKVGVQLSQSSGKLSMRNPVVFRVKDNPLYVLTKWLAMSLWLVFYLCLFQSYWHGVTKKLVRMFLGLTVVVLIVGVTLPGWVKNDLRRDVIREIKFCVVPIEQVVVKMHVVDVSSLKKMLKVDIAHLAHFLLFSFLAFLLILGNPKSSVLLVLTYLALIACSTELMQFYIEERSPLVQDFMIDMAGGGMVVWGWYLIGSNKGIERVDL
jgi:hypothetical protein